MNEDESTRDENDTFYMLNRRGAGSGVTTTYERTEFGKHIDHVKSFYAGLDASQKEAFLHPAHDDESLKFFEATLNESLLARWGELKAEADKLGGSFSPNEASEGELDFAVASLRSMMDDYPSSDPVSRGIQDNLIKKLGGIDAVDKIVQLTLNPEKGINALDPKVRETLLSAQGGVYSYTVKVEDDKREVTDAFFNGKPVDIVGTSGGGINILDPSDPKQVNAPEIQEPVVAVGFPLPGAGK